MLAEARVVLDALHGFLGCGLVRLFLAVSYAVGREDSAKQYGCFEHGIVLRVVIGVDKLKLNVDAIFLSPLYESRLEVLLGVDQRVDVDISLDDALGDESCAGFVAAVEVERSHKCFHGVTGDI